MLTYLPYILLSYGCSIQVVEPLRLKERMTAIAAELADHYRKIDALSEPI